MYKTLWLLSYSFSFLSLPSLLTAPPLYQPLLVRVAIAMMKHYNQKQLGEEGVYIPFIKGSQGRN